MFLRNPFSGAFGLEISDLTIKLIQLQRLSFIRKHYFEIKEIRSTSLPSGLIVNGEIQQPEMVRKKLLHLLGRDKQNKKFKPLKCNWVVAGLPEPKTFLKLLKIEALLDDITEVDVLYHAKKHLPFNIEEAYIDWQIINPENKESNARILLGAVPKVIADSYTYLLESAQLNPIALEIEAISLVRAMITAKKDYTGQARAIMDFGATRSSLIIYDNDTIQFSTSLNFSGELTTTALEQGLKIDHQRAEELKIKNGIKYDPQNPKYLKIISELLVKPLEDLRNALNFYNEHFSKQNPVSHITMCGGMSNWKGLSELICKKLNITANPGNVWKNLFNKKIEENKDDVTMAVAIGLALRASQKKI